MTDHVARLCNGSTADSDSVCLGSNPSRAATFYGGVCRHICPRGVAQFGRALRSGRRGRKFKSCHLDQKKRYQMKGISFYLVCTRLELAAGFSEFDELKRSANLGETVRWTVS